MKVRTGLDVLLRRGLYKDKVVGLITNHTGCGTDLRQNVDLMLEEGYRIGALFSPEHGLYGEYQDGETIGNARDPKTGIPVFSLYGADMTPSTESLRGLDALLFDIQDIGARHYTYPATMINSMEAAARSAVSFVVLDRPNPIGGVGVEGNVAAPDRLSFVCPAPTAVRHGLTIGELALLAAEWKGLPTPSVVRMEGWERDTWFDETGLPWVPPSPNAPTLSMAALYPGTCFVEGVNLSEARGTALPFEMAGAPWLDGDKLAEVMRRQNLPGVLWRPVRFRPSAGKWLDQSCGGVQAHIMDRSALRPVELGVRLLFAVRDLHPNMLAPVSPTEPSEPARYHMDLLAAGPGLRKALLGEEAPDRLLQEWQEQAQRFERERKRFFIY
ncbi:MAG: exo-beta-N-acetylmuramidase NamZ domain-containing protein [Bacillota bacterium]